MSNIICDKAGYALNVGDRVYVEPLILSKVTAGQPFYGTVTGFNPGAVYAIRVTNANGSYDWYRRSEVRKMAVHKGPAVKTDKRSFRI